MSVTDEIRNLLATRAGSRRTRNREFRADRPCDWQSTGMTDPRTGEIFTEDGAWEYVAEMIRSGVQIEIVDLQFPPGKKAYVMLIPSHSPGMPIYIKLQLGADCVIGRSFHYSTHPAAKNKGDGNAK